MFSDRVDAGDRLADRLLHLRGAEPVVVGLPRGGVPVACRVAQALDAPLDVILVRKLGVPFQPELAMGAIGEGGVKVINRDVVAMAGVADDDIAEVEDRERVELDRRSDRYRAGRRRLPLRDRVVVVVDDGLATGATARAACQIVRAEGASRVILAVPVAPSDWADELAGAADELVAVDTPYHFFGIGQFYRDFRPTSDREVVRCLDRCPPSDDARAGENPETDSAESGRRIADLDVEIPVDDTLLRGQLAIPVAPVGVVIFAHGSGSSRHSPRNRHVADLLNEAGLATLLFDLLTDPEAADRANVFDLDLLARRLVAVTDWVRERPALTGLAVGYFGASTGAGAALEAAAQLGTDVAAVVSRGGRPDLAGPRLPEVRAPTLLIVGGDDPAVLDLNRQADAQLAGPSRLDVIGGATHLFEEPGALDAVAAAARDWFLDHLAPRDRAGR